MKKLDGRSKAARALKARSQSHAAKCARGEVPTALQPLAEKYRAMNESARKHQVGGDHYMNMGVQPWDAMESWLSHEGFREYLRGNAIKYLARCNEKGGVEDIKKARHYLDKLIEVSGG